MVAHGDGLLFVGNADGEIQEIAFFLLDFAVDGIFTCGIFIIVSDNGHFVSEGHFVFLDIAVDVLTDGGGDLLSEIAEGHIAVLGEVILGSIPDGLHTDKPGLHQLRDGLLECEICGVFLVQHKFRNLGVGQRKIHFFQHI